MTLRYEWVWQSKASPDRLWPFLGDTNRTNRAAGLPTVRMQSHPLPNGGARLTGTARVLGTQVFWDERPYEWAAPHHFSIERVYHSGPLSRLVATTTLEPAGAGSTVTMSVEVESRGFFATLWTRWFVGIRTRRQMDRAMADVRRMAEAKADVRPAERPTLAGIAGTRLKDAREALSLVCNPALVERLCDLVAAAPEWELRRLRPFALARVWNADPMEVLRLCLHATDAGLLDLFWDAMCPHCRGAANRASSLAELTSQNHCATCNLDWEADFSRTVEVTFRPSGSIRETTDLAWCAGGPAVTPHVVAQRRVAAGVTATLELALPAGRYRVRAPQAEHPLLLDVVADAQAPVNVLFQLPLPEGAEQQVASTFTITASNPLDAEALVVVERTAWKDDVASAAVVTTQQQFRDLFAAEALAPGERLGVGHLTLLFTDLKDSTALYSAKGDAVAYALVREHFVALTQVVAECNGAVVKTIGDAVMAAFAEPVDALRAAERMHQVIAAQRGAQSLVLKVGLHAGSCLVVRLNDRLDYFGTNVNLAARAQAESVGGDVVVTSELAEDPSVAAWLNDRNPSRQPFTKALKGIREDTSLVRLRFDDAAETNAA